ncbi:MAG: hypothetical protein E7487_09495 [Ruminococcaceae bacterium]|nr:hypothetical protein [Oscillospiraceae bacterium]
MSEKNTALVLKAGVGRVVITPPLGTILYGYAPGRPAEAVGDDLHVIAAAMSYGDTTALVLSADVCTCPPELSDEIRTAIAKETGVPFGNIVFNTTHTHSGPVTSLKRSGWGTADVDFMYNNMLPNSVKAAAAAVKDLRPALFGVATTDSYVASNRRSITPDGKIGLGQCPWGLMDKEMTVLSFKDAETGKIILNMIHYCAHSTASGANPEITRDWPGPMKDILERESGGVTMFIAGSNGETGPRCPNGGTTQSYEAALELGKRAGHDAVTAWRKIKDWRNAPVVVVNGDVTIPYEPLPPKEVAQAEKDRLVSEEYLRSQKRFSEVNEIVRWEDILAEYESGNIKSHYVFPQSIIAVGTAAIVPFQFEMFMEMTLRLRLYSKFTHTLSLSNANGSLAYLPSQDQICRGGYEIWQFRYANTYKLVDDADNYMVTENLKLLDEAFEQCK